MSFEKIVSVCEVICDSGLIPVLAWLMEDSMIKENCKKRAGISGFPDSVDDNNENKTTIQLLYLPDGCNFHYAIWAYFAEDESSFLHCLHLVNAITVSL